MSARRVAASLGAALALLGAELGAQERCEVAEVVVQPGKSAIGVNQTFAFTATAYDARGTPCTGVRFRWTSSNANVAYIYADGSVRGVADGTTLVTAMAGSGETARSGSAVLSIATPFQPPTDGGFKTAPMITRDSDRDGVPDLRDRCRNTPAGTRVDSGGCAAPLVTVVLPPGPPGAVPTTPVSSAPPAAAPPGGLPTAQNPPAPRPASPSAAVLDPSLTAGFWVGPFTGGEADRAEYARHVVVKLDSALLALVDVFRATSGQPLVGATSPEMLSNREKGRWRRCRLLVFDIRTLSEAASFLRSESGPLQGAARDLSEAFDQFEAPEECDNIASMLEAPERWAPFQENYERSARAFYRDWYQQVRAVHEAGRAFARALNVVLPAQRQLPAMPALPPRPPTVGG